MWHHDQPFGDSSALPTFLLSELAREHVTVALCGDGGDDLLAGYERFAAAMAVARLRHAPPGLHHAARRVAALLPRSLLTGRMGSLQRLLAHSDEAPHRALLSWCSYLPAEWRQALLVSEPASTLSGYDAMWEDSQGCGLLDRLLLLSLRTYLLDDLLSKVDRMSMAHGLEVRSPFLDTGLVDLAFQLPPNSKLRGFSHKRALKEAMRDVLPKEILGRRKQGFGVPLDRWFRTDLRSYLEGVLGSRQAAIRHHLAPAAIDAMIAEHLSAATDHGESLWSLLTLEVFLQREGW